MIHFRTLRAVLNQAIEAKEASPATYPFGKGGFEVAKLAEETEKRYLPTEYLMKIKNTVSDTKNNEYARKLFLFSYFCYGISFVDMAYRDWETDRKSTRLNSSHSGESRMPSSA